MALLCEEIQPIGWVGGGGVLPHQRILFINDKSAVEAAAFLRECAITS